MGDIMASADDTRLPVLSDAIAAFGDAWARGDLATLDALLSPTYTHSDYLGGFQDRDAWLAYAASRTRVDTTVVFHDVRTRVFGNVAVVTGANAISYKGGGSTVEDQMVRFTQVWVWTGDRWLREAFQATKSGREMA
jgi:ketosteroid isomerase-like protein